MFPLIHNNPCIISKWIQLRALDALAERIWIFGRAPRSSISSGASSDGSIGQDRGLNPSSGTGIVVSRARVPHLPVQGELAFHLFCGLRVMVLVLDRDRSNGRTKGGNITGV